MSKNASLVCMVSIFLGFVLILLAHEMYDYQTEDISDEFESKIRSEIAQGDTDGVNDLIDERNHEISLIKDRTRALRNVGWIMVVSGSLILPYFYIHKWIEERKLKENDDKLGPDD